MSSDHETVQIPFSADLNDTTNAVERFSPDLAFNLVESVKGQGALSVLSPQLLETMKIPYTGNRPFAHALSADKSIAKRVLKLFGLPTPDDVYHPNSLYILKAETEHASINLDQSCIVSPKNADDLRRLISNKESETGLKWIAEEYVDGREYNVALLGDLVLPPAEMKFADGYKGYKILTYEAKWNEDADCYKQSARSFDIPADIRENLKRIAFDCREKLDLRGYTRLDFRQNAAGKLFIIDLNTNPCISPDSDFIAMARKAGLTDMDVMKRIIDDAFVS